MIKSSYMKGNDVTSVPSLSYVEQPTLKDEIFEFEIEFIKQIQENLFRTHYTSFFHI